MLTRRAVCGFPAVLLIAFGAFRATAVRAEGATKATERWLHVRVEKGGDDAAMVRVNVPLKMAERVLAAMLPEGKLKLDKEPELLAVLMSVRTMEDNEYVTVDTVEGSIRVPKEHGYLVVEGMEIGKREKTRHKDSLSCGGSDDPRERGRAGRAGRPPGPGRARRPAGGSLQRDHAGQGLDR